MRGGTADVAVVAKMEDNFVAGNGFLHRLPVAHVGLHKTKAGMLPDFGQIGGAPGLEVVIDRHGGTLGDKPFGQMAADKAGPAEHHDLFGFQVHRMVLIYERRFAIYDFNP